MRSYAVWDETITGHSSGWELVDEPALLSRYPWLVAVLTWHSPALSVPDTLIGWSMLTTHRRLLIELVGETSRPAVPDLPPPVPVFRLPAAWDYKVMILAKGYRPTRFRYQAAELHQGPIGSLLLAQRPGETVHQVLALTRRWVLTITLVPRQAGQPATEPRR